MQDRVAVKQQLGINVVVLIRRCYTALMKRLYILHRYISIVITRLRCEAQNPILDRINETSELVTQFCQR
jgi:hypothetical protein